MTAQREPSSFRDRSGYIFYEGEKVFRVVGNSYKKEYDQLHSSGLYKHLTENGLLIAHEEVPADLWPAHLASSDVYKLVQVPTLPFVSYSYEWSFQQLKEAALLTVQIQLAALAHGMTLKDASSFNVQFSGGKPLFIDTLSFEEYEEGRPWVAYRQFCTHFLAPLSLISLVSPDLRRLSQLSVEGIPLSLTSRLLPRKTRFSPFFQMHIHLHAKLENKYSGDVQASKKVTRSLSKTRLTAIISHLQSGVNSLQLPVSKTEWSDYYEQFSYSDASIEHKKTLVREWAGEIMPARTWDLGCNTGLFSEVVQAVSGQVVSFDIDYMAIEKFYAALKKKPYTNVLPLVLDLGNPTPAIGWANLERKSFADRGPADLILSLALIHHLCLGNNVPLGHVASLFAKLARHLVIEFVPKSDPQSQRLLVTRADVFDDYHKEGFEAAFGEYFTIRKRELISGTERTLYLMTCKS
ncbi:MAG: Nodulation protein noeA [Flaviaesturariibacter sp.]|nr:Nodulation protein noeA [Flaviaesturariibacter sp.]